MEELAGVDYQKIATEARKKVLQMIYDAQSSHIGSNFSVIDILAVLFEKADLSKDKIILSAGWKAASFYYFLAQKGIISKEDLDTFCKEGSKYIGLTEPTVNGIEFAGGSMGMGFPAAVGFSLAKKIKKEEGKVYVIMSDGELQCGTTWESALIASHQKLDNLIVIVDNNGLQGMGEVRNILQDTQFPLFIGWNQNASSGHDYEWIEKNIKSSGTHPTLFLAHTVKGKGVSFFENNNLYHYKAPSKEEYDIAMQELQ